MLNELVRNPFFQIFFTIFISGLFYYKSVKRKNISYRFESTEIVNKGKILFPKLQIKYENIDIKNNLIITTYIIWNSGNDIINQSDIAKTLSIISNHKDTIILKCIIVDCNNSANKFDINDIVKINFDYIDPQDCVKIQVLHTGDNNHIEIEGLIKNKGKIINTNKYLDKKITNSRRIYIFSFIFALIIILFQSFLFKYKTNIIIEYFELLTSINGLLVLLFLTISYCIFIYNEIIDSLVSIPKYFRDK